MGLTALRSPWATKTYLQGYENQVLTGDTKRDGHFDGRRQTEAVEENLLVSAPSSGDLLE